MAYPYYIGGAVMTLFFCLLIIFCAIWLLLSITTQKKIFHYVFVVRNQQTCIEWKLRRQLMKAWHPNDVVYMTVIDCQSTDNTLDIVQSLSLTHPICCYSVTNFAEKNRILYELGTRKMSNEQVFIYHFTD